MSEPPAILLDSLTLRYQDFAALRDVSLTVMAGEKVVLIGPSGSGKSSLIRCINGLAEPQEGCCLIEGEIVTGRPKAMLAARQRMGTIFQQFNLYSNRTALDNVALGLVHLKGLSRRAAEARAKAALAEVGCETLAAHYPFQLSGGQQQRVALARALVMQPEILLLDEPTSALDPELIQSMLEVILRVVDQAGARTVVCATHEMGFARRLAHKVIFMADGAIVEEGTPEEIFDHPRSDRLRRFLAQIGRQGR